MNNVLLEKYGQLKNKLKALKQVVVAYSGGVDSTLLLKVSKDVLGENVVALMAKSPSMPEKEFREALKIAQNMGVSPVVLETNEISLPEYYNNTIDRCYYCKKEIFGAFKDYLTKSGLGNLIDGSNYDDLSDYRPGIKALIELKVASPLKEVGLTKAEIRELSKELNLDTWNKEAMACLATRIEYNTTITVERLKQIEKAEVFLREKGFSNVRTRLYGKGARIEVHPSEVEKFFINEVRNEIVEKMKSFGFKSISVDLEGYRMGNMNNLFEK